MEFAPGKEGIRSNRDLGSARYLTKNPHIPYRFAAVVRARA